MIKMKAIICTKYGKPDVLQMVNVKKPIPKQDEVLVKIHATAVTASDCVIRELRVPGGYQFPLKQLMRFAMRLFIGFNKPRNPILGLVFSGEIESIGKSITNFKIGDEVFGFTGASRGTYAEYKCVSAKEILAGEVILKPNNLSHEKAVAIIYGGVLAIHFMINANIKRNQKVLIYGASGAIGTAAIQLVKHHGAIVTAVCSENNFEMVASLGSDKMLDYKRKGAENQLEEYDFILDAVGKNKSSKLKKACRKSLIQYGKYVSVDDGLFKMQPDYLSKLNIFIKNEDIQAVIDKIYPLEKIVAAHSYVDMGHKKGNVIIILN